jgi:uncharacterized protein YjiS (DUF1127 family)
MRTGQGQKVSVFDPCSSRHDPKLQSGIRRLLEKMAYELSPLRLEGENAQCCSFGGQTAIANPGLVQKAVAWRIGQSPHPYVVYCVNCRDTFAAAGKPTAHILDLLFGQEGFERPVPTWSQRRQNRQELKRILTATAREEAPVLPHVDISESLKQKLHSAYLLEEDCIKTLLYCEQTGKKLYDAKKDAFIGHLLIGYMTHWVEYRRQGDGFVLLNAYAHRMQIQEG